MMKILHRSIQKIQRKAKPNIAPTSASKERNPSAMTPAILAELKVLILAKKK